MGAPFPDDIAADLAAGLEGRYAIERRLGAGGMAVVYLARDLQHARHVALKVMSHEIGAAAAARFHREIRLSAQLVHPHIVPLLDSGETAGRLWYTMPFVQGESLRQRLDREQQLPIDEAIRLTREIADALGHAHSREILHRDIKPENILLADGHALVADFGIARALDGGDRLTGTGVAVGTPGYMSPEQSSGELRIDARSDLYSLASICYEMLAGEPPFTGPTAQAVIARRLSLPPPSLRTTRSAAPEALDQVIRRGLAQAPADRYPTVLDFSRALAEAVTGAPVAAAARPRWPLALAGAVMLAVGWMLWNSATDRAESPAVSGAVRIAVMPFRLIGGDSSDRYLADGITEEVNATLSNLGGLRVIAQSSVASTVVPAQSAREIGAALHADALVEGDLQRAGTAVRVRVRLVDAATEEQRWSQQYDHTSADIFQIQSEVASRVAGVLRIQLAERESRALSRPPTTNAAAYDRYLRARAAGLSSTISEQALDSVIAQLREAVRLDSTFALARGTLATVLINSVFLFDADTSRLGEAERQIAASLALDSSLAVTWKAESDLAWNAVRGWNFGDAMAGARRALQAQPSHVPAHNALASLYFHYGFMDEAETELAASLSLDPSDGCAAGTSCIGFSKPRVARVFWYRQQFDSALAAYRRLPQRSSFAWEKAVVFNALGRPGEGLAALDSLRTPGVSESSDAEAARGLLHASLGHAPQALGYLHAATAHAKSRSHFHHAQFTIACAYARLGRKGDAVEWLRKTANNGLANYPLFRNDPNLKSLQGEPEYEALMKVLQAQHEELARLVRGGLLVTPSPQGEGAELNR